MKVGILFNCQHRMLADVLRVMRPDIEVVDFLVNVMWDGERQSAVAEALLSCDLVLSLRLGPDWGRLATETLAQGVPRMAILPPFTFGGFHPDTVYIRGETAAIKGFTDDYHSRIAVAGFLEGRPARRTADLYNALVMGRAGYFNAFAEERTLLCQSFTEVSIDLAPLFDRWAARGCFMHSINHPKHWCFADVALALCHYAGLVERSATVDPALVNDALGDGPTHPVLAPLARRLGVPAEDRFKPVQSLSHPPVPLERFVELEFECFEEVPIARLEAVPGVTALRAALR